MNPTELELAAIQLASISANYANKSLWGKFVYRFRREFLQQDTRHKLRFLKTMLGKIGPLFMAPIRRRRRRVTRTVRSEGQMTVAAVCTGGLGDILIARAFLEQFVQEYAIAQLDIVVAPGRISGAQFVFRDSRVLRNILAEADLAPASTEYDLILKVGDLVSFEFVRAEALTQWPAPLREKLAAAQQLQDQYRTFINRQPMLDGLFATHAAHAGMGRLDVLGWMTCINFTQSSPLLLSLDPQARAVFERFPTLQSNTEASPVRRPYITLHNGWDNVDHKHAEQVTKAWPAAHFAEFVTLFKARFPQVQVVQLGTKTSQPIPGVDLSLLNATSLEETAWVLRHSRLHLDGDSGLVHIARALQTTSLVLFGPTNHEFFAYRENLNYASTGCRNCWWTTNDWMHVCPRGQREPECMTSLLPSEVLRRASEHLEQLGLQPAQQSA
ncbi:MAG: glycosyltransferase family 9 protein [Planctomycetes bacterium]|nr:glycosyltransferase family 9 protein [Planctomycetota bacterium]